MFDITHTSAHSHGEKLNFCSGFFELLREWWSEHGCLKYLHQPWASTPGQKKILPRGIRMQMEIELHVQQFYIKTIKGFLSNLWCKMRKWWCKMRKWTQGVILQKLSNCVCVFAELCKWQMRLCISKPCNVHPTSVLLWKRGRRETERGALREELSILVSIHLAVCSFYGLNQFSYSLTQIKQEVSKLNSSFMTVTALFFETFTHFCKENKSICDWIIVRENS